MTERFPLAVLASGRGSNLQALIDAQRAGTLPIDIVLVAGDKQQALALRRAEEAGIPTLALDPKTYPDRAAFDTDLFTRVAAYRPRLIVLAGFMRILNAAVLAPWAGRIINIHPSLLPKYRGLHTHRRALEAGDAVHGSSVHYVTAELDGGPMIAQVQMPILPGDTDETLAERLLPHEHRLLVAVLAHIAAARIALHGTDVSLDGRVLSSPLRLREDGVLAA
ncbi:MAG: phosphoribosylglycinamide formyltransferase [Rhodanobacter sp.]|jgi:phosphoribosylglycinamide formyltransferase-1|nr:phosphoribosylglycinamide formyltransferase [Rhodanobacter sp.]